MAGQGGLSLLVATSVSTLSVSEMDLVLQCLGQNAENFVCKEAQGLGRCEGYMVMIKHLPTKVTGGRRDV